MKKMYSVNVKRNDSGNDWKDSDMADWFKLWNDAFDVAENAFEDSEVEEVMLAIWEDGDIEDFPLHIVKENGTIKQYQNGELLWA